MIKINIIFCILRYELTKNLTYKSYWINIFVGLLLYSNANNFY